MRHSLLNTLRRAPLTVRQQQQPSQLTCRAFTASAFRLAEKQVQPAAVSNSRWLTDIRKRMQKLSTDTLDATSKESLAGWKAYLDKNWLLLSAGRDGFIMDEEWWGMVNHQIFWGDMDCMGHTNNVIYNRWAESGRVNWFMILSKHVAPENEEEMRLLMTPRGVGLILGSIKTDFKFPMAFPDHICVMHRLTTKPDYTSDRVILSAACYSMNHRRIAAKFEEDIVVYDYDKAKKTPLKPYMVDEMLKVWELQEQSKTEANKKIAELEAFITSLE